MNWRGTSELTALQGARREEQRRQRRGRERQRARVGSGRRRTGTRRSLRASARRSLSRTRMRPRRHGPDGARSQHCHPYPASPAARTGRQNMVLGDIGLLGHGQPTAVGTGLTAQFAPAPDLRLLLRTAEGVRGRRHRGVPRIVPRATPPTPPSTPSTARWPWPVPPPRLPGRSPVAEAARSPRGDPHATRTPAPTT